MYTKENQLKDVYAHPIGRDMLRKILHAMGQKDNAIEFPVIGNIRLKLLPKLSGGRVSEDFLEQFLQLLNSETDRPPEEEPSCPAWWKEAVFYQIYPRSFKDSNGDGIGDLGGVLEKLDYLQALGVDAVWLCPIYDSPNDDNGYDIRDYRRIMAEFGSMEDFDRLLKELHARGMRLVMDLVVNHTSDEHQWFQHALADPDSPYKDYYFFRDQPNNWTSFFSGSAWNYYQELHQYALHLFTKKQMDLNWENPSLRAEIKKMIRWWLEKGVDGFRLDVINYISKREGLPDGNPEVAELMGYCGVEHYFYGPKLHEYLKELKAEAFVPFSAFSVGETPGVGMEMSKLLTAPSRGELDMIFSFDHLETPGHSRFQNYRYDLNYYKTYMTDWMEHYTPVSQVALYYENHDNPRMISKVDPDPEYRIPLAKLLAVMQLTLKGTPFLFQGQELGMINRDFSRIEELRDVESLNLYNELCRTLSPSEAFAKVLSGSRDHARTPMQWTAAPNAGFSEGEPWIGVNNDYRHCNAEDQVKDPSSVWNFYRSLIALRKAHPSLVYGEIEVVNKKEKDLFTYYRSDRTESFYVECNLGRHCRKHKEMPHCGERILSNYPEPAAELRPYEATVWRI